MTRGPSVELMTRHWGWPRCRTSAIGCRRVARPAAARSIMSEAFEVDTAALREHAEHWGVIADEIASVGEAIQGLSPLAWGLGAITDPGVSFHQA
ncbi:hypothetical protein FH969_10675 [Miniimonas arenae]|uniref:Uncharacterized protein n=2 Tax=Miniimonas arenae TaxID=676201 RepID=A0A5C5BAS0_9MICO|nr:hypothetical protein FH969_10675 [Miniimonas arenae]